MTDGTNRTYRTDSTDRTDMDTCMVRCGVGGYDSCSMQDDSQGMQVNGPAREVMPICIGETWRSSGACWEAERTLTLMDCGLLQRAVLVL